MICKNPLFRSGLPKQCIYQKKVSTKKEKGCNSSLFDKPINSINQPHFCAAIAIAQTLQ
jgi:hypothetical protein